jgi:hypothetical protein
MARPRLTILPAGEKALALVSRTAVVKVRNILLILGEE